jgi:hypothetical protein
VQGVGRPALLHEDRGEPGVGGARLQERRDDVGPQPRVEVVDVGLDDQGRGGGLDGGRGADQQPDDVRVALGVASARADPDDVDRHRGLGAELVRQHRQQGGSGGRGQLEVDRAAVRRQAAQQLDHRGHRHTHLAVGDPDRAAAERDRRAHQPVQAQVHEPGGHPDDVGDRVERPDLVEVHVVDRDAVHHGLGLGDPAEDLQGDVAHHGIEPGSLDQHPHVRPAALGHGVRDADVAARRREPVARGRLRPELDRLGGDRVDGGTDHVQGHPCAEQRAEQHVAAGAGRGVQPGDPALRGHQRAPALRATRAANTPAP